LAYANEAKIKTLLGIWCVKYGRDQAAAMMNARIREAEMEEYISVVVVAN
jgi:hypothetical protein